MFAPWLHVRFNLPIVLSLAEWSALTFFWRAAAKKASPAKSSESRKSRRVHQTLLNTALLLVALPIRGPRPRPLPDAIWIAWLGLGIQTASAVLAVRARQHLASQWSGEITIKVDHELIRSGPYRFVRHPIYTGILGMFLGAAIVSGGWQGILGLGMSCGAYWRKIRLEEANLRKAFGPVYDAYRRETGSLIPKLW